MAFFLGVLALFLGAVTVITTEVAWIRIVGIVFLVCWGLNWAYQIGQYAVKESNKK